MNYDDFKKQFIKKPWGNQDALVDVLLTYPYFYQAKKDELSASGYIVSLTGSPTWCVVQPQDDWRKWFIMGYIHEGSWPVSCPAHPRRPILGPVTCPECYDALMMKPSIIRHADIKEWSKAWLCSRAS